MNSYRIKALVPQVRYFSKGKGRGKRRKVVYVWKTGTVHLTGKKDTWAEQRVS
jgi:hypothetical protein